MGITQKSIQAMQGLPFDNLIGGPLNACIRAQADAAQTTLKFINDVGLNESTDAEGNSVKEAIYVYFSFVQGGRKAVMSVPLLTIVPIPYIAINTIDINFKATITGVESSSFTSEFSEESTRETNTQKKTNLLFYKKTTNLKTTLSSKRDSKSTRDSSFSIESTIDVNVHASQDSMPAGMAKVLEMLGSSMDLLDPNGELSVNANEFFLPTATDTAELVAQYKSPKGQFDCSGIKVVDGTGKEVKAVSEDKSEGMKTYKLAVSDKAYKVTVGTAHSVEVTVKKQAAS